uniref:Uncharacterized protein n=1 Tax=Anopheles farauti TaxID=69004 RepID=A0A182QBF9_9DIPT
MASAPHTPNDCRAMRFFRIEKPPGVPHIALKLLKFVGVSEVKAERYRYAPMFVAFLIIIALPKIAFGYPDFETSIIGLAELFFQTNRFVGVLLLVLYHDTLFTLIRDAESFTKLVLQESSTVSQYLIAKDAQISKITRLYLIALLVPANFYSYSPILSTLWKYYNTPGNDTTPEFILSMEENFYGLDIRASLDHYLIFGTIMIPTSFLCALVGTAKLVSILSVIKYCTIYFELVTLKLDEMKQKQSFHLEMRTVLRMHQEALHCADLLKELTAPIMLLQLILCILVWSSMLLYFTVSLEQPPGVPHLILKLLKFLGFGERLRDRCRILAMILAYVFILVIPKCFFGYPSFDVAIIGTAELFFQSNTFCGIFMLFFKKPKLDQLIERAKEISKKVLSESSPAIVQHLNVQHALIHRGTRIFCIVVMYAAHFYVFLPFLSTLYNLYVAPRDVNETVYYTLHMEENFYDLPIRTSAEHYLLFGTIMTPMSYLCAFVGTVKILTIWNLTAYCIVYFQLVQVKLQEVTRDNTFHQELKTIIEMHQEALGCAKLLESTTSLVLLQQLVLCVLIWSSMLLFFTVSSAKVAYLLHESSWEIQTPALRRDLLLMMLRAQHPVGISAGKFCFMNMEQFGKFPPSRNPSSTRQTPALFVIVTVDALKLKDLRNIL